MYARKLQKNMIATSRSVPIALRIVPGVIGSLTFFGVSVGASDPS